MQKRKKKKSNKIERRKNKINRKKDGDSDTTKRKYE